MSIKLLKTKAILIKKEILTLYFAYKNPKLPILPKIIIIIALGYALSPIDLIPDFIPILGYLDDLILIPLFIKLSLKLIPTEIIIDARMKAETEPINLRKRWFFGIIFIIIWLVLIYVIIIHISNYAYLNK